MGRPWQNRLPRGRTGRVRPVRLLGGRNVTGVADIGSTAATGPGRTVTLLHSDFEDGPRLWAACPDAMSESAGIHREIVARAVARHGGTWPADQREAGAAVASFTLAAD